MAAEALVGGDFADTQAYGDEFVAEPEGEEVFGDLGGFAEVDVHASPALLEDGGEAFERGLGTGFEEDARQVGLAPDFLAKGAIAGEHFGFEEEPQEGDAAIDEPLLQVAGTGGNLRQGLGEARGGLAHNLGKERLLGAEALVNGDLGNAGRLGDGFDGGGLVTFTQEVLGGGFENGSRFAFVGRAAGRPAGVGPVFGTQGVHHEFVTEMEFDRRVIPQDTERIRFVNKFMSLGRKIRMFSAAGMILLVVVGVIAGVKALQVRAMIASGENFTMPPEAVSSAPVEKDAWETTFEAVGSLRPVQGANLSTEASGVVRRIHFDNGAEVRQGDLLVELDTESEEAQLRSALAEADLARTTVERNRLLREKNTIAQSDLDAAESQFRRATAVVEQLRAMIDKKQVRAPFAGRVGIRQVNVGQFVNNGDPIVSLQSLDPIFVDFLLPQQRLAQLEPGLEVRVTTDAYPDETFEGRLTAVNPHVDAVSRSVLVQATLSNPGGRLRPGMFARAAVVLPEKEAVVRIPATAILFAPYGDSVFVIKEEKNGQTGEPQLVAEQRFIRVGRSLGDFVAVTAGVEPGEQVVAAGAFKLRNGSSVRIENDLAPQPKIAPKPADT